MAQHGLVHTVGRGKSVASAQIIPTHQLKQPLRETRRHFIARETRVNRRWLHDILYQRVQSFSRRNVVAA